MDPTREAACSRPSSSPASAPTPTSTRASATTEPSPAPAGRGVPRPLDREEIEAFLRAQRVARIGCHADGETYVVPVIYAYDGRSIVAVTTEGRKISMLRSNPRACVEVDEYDADGRGSWRSVIAQGVYEELAEAEIPAALDLLRERFAQAAGRSAEPRTLGPGVIVFRIRLGELAGRSVER